MESIDIGIYYQCLDEERTMVKDNKIIYIVENIIWMFITMIWYRNLMFRGIPNFTYTVSKNILWGLLITSIAIGFLLDWFREYEGWYVIANLSIAYGIYTMITFYEYLKVFIWIILLVIGILSLWMCVCIFHKSIHSKNRRALYLKKYYRC